MRGFWDGALAPEPFAEVFTDANHPYGISPVGISVPIQNPFNPFTVADYTSPEGDEGPVKKVTVPPGTPLTTGVRYTALEAGPRTNKITTHNYEFTGGLKGNLAQFGDYFKSWNWENGFRYNEDERIQRKAGSWITMRCGRRYSTQIRQPPLIHSALTRTRPRSLIKFCHDPKPWHDLAAARRPQVIRRALESPSGAHLFCDRQ